MKSIKTKRNQPLPKGSQMLEELNLLKIYGGRSSESKKLVMGNCKSICQRV